MLLIGMIAKAFTSHSEMIQWEKLVDCGETWHYPHPRLIFGTLTSRSDWLQRRFKGNTRCPSCRQPLDLRPGAGCRVWSMLDLIGGDGGMGQGGSKLSHIHTRC